MFGKLYQAVIKLTIVLLLVSGAATVHAQHLETDSGNFQTEQLRRTRTPLNRNEILESNRGDAAIARPNFIPAGGELDPAFSSNILDEYSIVEEIVVQPDGRILVGGTFQTYNGFAQGNLIRLNADGSIDASFRPVVSGGVLTVVLQADGKILIGGFFLTVNGVSAHRIARLNADGTSDVTFNTGTGASNPVYSIALQSDGKIVIGGSFTQINNVLRQYVAMLNADGSLNNGFAPSVNRTVFAVASQADGKILIAGHFSGVNNFARNRLARLNPNGTLDSSFSSSAGLSNSAYDLALQPDGKIIVGGVFTTAGGQSRQSIARFNTDGSLDVGFNPGTNLSYSRVVEIRVQPDGKILVGGELNGQYNGNLLVSFVGVRRLYSDGGLDESFGAGSNANSMVEALAIQPDGKILIGGSFDSFNANSARRFARLNADGSYDNSLNTGSGFYALFSGFIYKILRQPDGKILIGGYFTHVGNVRRDGIARLNADGSLDASFNPGSGTFSFKNRYNLVYAITLQPDGKILIGGDFDRYNGVYRERNARLNPDGSLDTSFSITGDFDLYVNDLVVQPDGKILQSAVFSYLKRLNADGTTDTTFNVNVSMEIRKIVFQGDKILIGGAFSSINGVSRNRIARLNPDGSLDTTFNPGAGADSTVISIYPQSDGKILIGGNFNNFNGVPRNRLARLNADGSLDNTFVPAIGGTGNGGVTDIVAQSNGSILAGGYFYAADNSFRTGIVRLTSTGSLDSAFNPITNSGVLSLAIQPDGKILIGGFFDQVNGFTKDGIARLLNSSYAPRTLFDFDGDGKADVSVFRPTNGAWYLQQSSNGFTGVSFGASNDRIVPADYDGDGKTDIAVFRSGTWYLQRSQLGFTGVSFGEANDIPAPADYDGDGRADVGVFRPSNGVWYLLRSQLGFAGVAFGQNGDRPVAADYDGDGKADVAVNRNGTWYIQRSQLGFTGIAFGDGIDKPVPADYDADGKTDVAVFRPTNGVWYLLQSTTGFTGVAFGLGTDLPVPADYDGDNKADVAVFRNGTWYLQKSTQGFTGVSFGTSGDKPIPNAFLP